MKLFASFFAKSYLDLNTYVGELETRLAACESLLVSVKGMEASIHAARQEVHLLFTEIEMSLQALGFVNAELRRLPLTAHTAPIVPTVLTADHRQRDDALVQG